MTEKSSAETAVKHTAAPWKFDSDSGRILSHKNEAVAGVYSLNGIRDGEEEANGVLIAAAPQMLEALEAATTLLTTVLNRDCSKMFSADEYGAALSQNSQIKNILRLAKGEK